MGVVHKTSSCERADKGSLSGCGVLPRSQFKGETLPMEGTLRLNGDGDVRCELSNDEEPSMVRRRAGAGRSTRFAGYFGRLAIAADPRDSCGNSCGAAAATRVDGWGW